MGQLPRELSKLIANCHDLKLEGRVKDVEAVHASGGRGLQIPIQIKIKYRDLKKLQFITKKLKALKRKKKIVVVSLPIIPLERGVFLLLYDRGGAEVI